MENKEIQELLENILLVNERILDSLTDIRSDLFVIRNELSWVEEYSYAKTVYDQLNEISRKLDSIDINTSR